MRKDIKGIIDVYLVSHKQVVKDHKENGILLLHNWNGELREYGKTGIDKFLGKVGLRAGV